MPLDPAHPLYDHSRPAQPIPEIVHRYMPQGFELRNSA